MTCFCFRLSRLKILELRENHLKTLPKSFSRLTELEKLDIGHNEFTELVGFFHVVLVLRRFHTSLTHLSLVSLLWDIGKQYSPRCLLTGIPSKNGIKF